MDEAVERPEQILEAKGVTLFVLIDHSGDAEKGRNENASTKLLIFANPKASTPVMLAVPRSAIDLPLRILIWEDTEGFWVTCNNPRYLLAAAWLWRSCFRTSPSWKH